MNTRATSYLQHMLNNPGTWVHIRKKRSKSTMMSSRQISAERRDVYKEVLTILRIMGIAHEVAGSGTYKISIKCE